MTCECGCGQVTQVYTRNRGERGAVKGEHARFVPGHSGAKRGPDDGLTFRERENATRRRRYASDPAYRERRLERDARLREAFVEHVERLVLLERDDGVCGICGGDVDPLNFHVDHVVPLAAGGLHHYGNVQTAHPVCNYSKGSR